MVNITTIPSTAPFLDHLVKTILSGDLPKKGGKPPTPEELANMTLLLPTRRACRVCGEAFLRLSGNNAILLPKIQPLGEGDEEQSLVYDSLTPLKSGETLSDLNPAIAATERHLVITQMIMSWMQTAPTHPLLKGEEERGKQARGSKLATASLMAHELSKLMDNAETEAVDLNQLKTLVPAEFSDHWQQTLEFLTIITEQWPSYLDATEQISAIARKNTLLLKQAERLAAVPPTEPIIIAGSTGTIPAAAELIKAVSKLANGAIVLPGLDHHLPPETFKTIQKDHPEHPQFGIAKLLSDLEVTNDKVSLLPGAEPKGSEQELMTFLSEALRPSSSTEAWQTYQQDITTNQDRNQNLAAAFQGINLNITRDPQEEAETISLILRRTAETKGKTAALITPDRLLARRVAIRLEAWGIKVDDSGGRPLAKTLPGAFMDLIIDCIAQDFAPTSLLALLKHPLTQLQFEKGDVRLAARALELTALRRPWFGGGFEGIETALKTTKDELETDSHTHPAVARLSEEEWFLAETLLKRVKDAFVPFIACVNEPADQSLLDLIKAHIDVAEQCSTDQNQSSDKLWQGAAGEQLAKLLAELLTLKSVAPTLSATDYPEFYRSLIAGETMRPLTPVHPRLFIWGPFEARLQQPDVVILGGLNEGTWPSATEVTPWLSRPMLQQLGLPAPEQQIGYSAHDFASLLSAKEVHITRAAKTDGVQTVPSRWVMRIEALLDGLGQTKLLAPESKEPFALWAGERDKAPNTPPAPAPAPTPPVKARPRRLSVTRIEDWIANPYSIYARYILRLAPLDPLASLPSAALKGQIIHTAMETFAKKYPETLPPDPKAEIEQTGRDLLQQWHQHPQIGAFWQPRFARFAAWFAETEKARRQAVKTVWSEQTGSHTYELKGGPFTLTARADRIDENQAGHYHIYDYKTGNAPPLRQVKSLLKPQLPLEAAILEHGGFANLPQGEVTALSYIEAKGAEPPGKTTTLDGQAVETAIEAAERDLLALIDAFDEESTPYKALRRKDFKGHYQYDEYAHLARVDEWGQQDQDGEGQ